MEVTVTAATVIARSAATTIPHTTKLPSATTIPPTNHGRAATGRNTAQAAVRISDPARATARPIPPGAAVIGMTTVAIAGSSWLPVSVTAIPMGVGSITIPLSTDAQELVPPAARRLIPMAITQVRRSTRHTAAPSTATDSIAPLVLPMSARSAM